MKLPDYESRMLQEGTYTFMLIEEPEKRKRSGRQGDFITVSFTFKVTGNNETKRYHKESMLPWTDIYGQLLKALGGKEADDGRIHLDENLDIIGASFEADIVHEPDAKDSQKKWARIANIQVDSDSDEEVPF